MRIISEFHDYYDVVQAMGQDHNLVYLRKPVEAYYEDEYPFPTIQKWGGWTWTISLLKYPFVVQHIVGFCGKIYPVLEVQNVKCFNIEDVDRVIEASFKPKAVEEYYCLKKSKRNKWWRRERYFSSSWRREVFEIFFAICEEKKSAFEEIFREHSCSVFVTSCIPRRHRMETKIVYNSSLQEMEFFRLFDPFTAFQEIAMYLGGMAKPNKSIPDISDKDMIIAKGFDKWSFRKESKRKS